MPRLFSLSFDTPRQPIFAIFAIFSSFQPLPEGHYIFQPLPAIDISPLAFASYVITPAAISLVAAIAIDYYAIIDAIISLISFHCHYAIFIFFLLDAIIADYLLPIDSSLPDC